MARALAGPMPSRSCRTRNQLTSSRGFSSSRRMGQDIFDVRDSRNLSPPNLTNGMLRRVSSSSSKSLCGRCGTAPPAGGVACPARGVRGPARTPGRLLGLVGAGQPEAVGATGAHWAEIFRKPFAGMGDDRVRDVEDWARER